MCIADISRGQAIKVQISVLSLAPARVKVEGERETGTKVWSFRHDYAGIIGLAERIENLSLSEAHGLNVPVHKLAAGEYETTTAATKWSYEVKLDAPVQPTDAAYVSWLMSERGFLMLGDLLPLLNDESKGTSQKKPSATLSFILPSGWSVATNETKITDAQYATTDAEQAVFFVGQGLRTRNEKVGSMEFVSVIAGQWAFVDEDVHSLAVSILKDYSATVGCTPRSRVMLMLAPFPKPVGAERWSAETRGSTTMLLNGRSPSKIAGLTQLSVPLSHELFHLWVPNGLALSGNYDWFYEGFTVYQSLRCRMRLHLLTFRDYLDALGRAFDAYTFASQHNKLSLIEASQRRWTGSTGLVYQKGLLVAFLYDLTVRQLTASKRTLDDVYQELFRLYQRAVIKVEGNPAVIIALSIPDAMRSFVHLYVESASAIDFNVVIAPFGLKVATGGIQKHVVVANKLKREQRDVLRKLGYDDKLHDFLPSALN